MYKLFSPESNLTQIIDVYSFQLNVEIENHKQSQIQFIEHKHKLQIKCKGLCAKPQYKPIIYLMYKIVNML